jgi:hypothetical protein
LTFVLKPLFVTANPGVDAPTLIMAMLTLTGLPPCGDARATPPGKLDDMACNAEMCHNHA